jgi:hypothetical protein
MAMFHTPQVLGRAWRRGLRAGALVALASPAGIFACSAASCACRSGLVLKEGVLEQGALLGVHRLGLGAKLPAFEARQFEVDLLELCIAQSNLTGLRFAPYALTAQSALRLPGRHGSDQWEVHNCWTWASSCPSQNAQTISECDVNQITWWRCSYLSFRCG